uniref:Retrotransposon gag domain-containing protein n=1 Tax=Cajanus cajan TaxID=3821 RepID=A0A151UFM6_CAJCA
MEKIFSVLGSSEERKLAYAVRILAGKAEYWWRGTKQMVESRGVPVDWDGFRGSFWRKYFLDSVRYAKEVEFMRLQHGRMSVSNYVMRFEQLTRFYSRAIIEAWRCRKFVEGVEACAERGS